MSRSKYERIIEKLFFDRYSGETANLQFEREDIASAAEKLGLSPPKNLGDVIYSYRYRRPMPESVCETAGTGHVWVIRSTARGQYCFAHVRDIVLEPNPNLVATKIPDSTPGVIDMYALGDEQALLAKVRYNRLVDIFTGLTCYSLQNHLRTAIAGVQVETDEVYVGIDSHGVHYVLPVQAKGESEALGRIQFEQDIEVCREKFGRLIPRLIGTQFTESGLIALFELQETDEGFGVVNEKHYRLVPPEEFSEEELREYQRRVHNRP
ncbi:MAG: endonuclease [Armatimonadota bacterium]|nr:endonuclease [Armatimonadota bacterium]